MQRKEQLEQLIQSLIEAINENVRSSDKIRAILQGIESQGFEIHISLLAGIILRDREDDEELREYFEEEAFHDPDGSEFFQEFFMDRSHPLFSDSDLHFLQELGIEPD